MNFLLRSIPSLLLISPLLGDGTEINQETLKKLKLPGIRINLEAKAVDVTSTITLVEGSLEFIDCA